ncbi:hypothetical protein HWV62_19527, partial [Athelia sp. TMB]
PGAFAAPRQNFFEGSERLYCWTDSLAMLLHSWTPEEAKEHFSTTYPPVPKPWAFVDPEKFLIILSLHPELIPCAARPSTVFLFMSQANFLEAWYTWLMPGLIELGHNANYWNPIELYSHVMAVLASNKPKTFTFNQTPSAANTKLILHARLCLILNETQKIRDSNKLIKKLGKVKLTRNDVDKLIGSIITCADIGDRVEPKKTYGKRQRLQPQIYTPAELGLQPISFRPVVYARCGRDIHILKNHENGEEVGGIQFRHPALELKPKQSLPSIWDTLVQHHQDVSTFKGIQRGAAFQAAHTGDMVAIGSRQPAGGIPGDTYREYPGLSGENLEGIKTLFSYAYDADVLDAIISGMAPKLFAELHNIFKEYQVNRLGSTGNNMYYCHNYTSPQHRDEDEGVSFCIQLGKRCYPDEFNFAFTEWGVYIVTEEKCIWWFISSHVHGTVMPRLSSLEKGVLVRDNGDEDGPGHYEPVVSNGDHPSAQKRSAARARQRCAARLAYQDRTQWWERYNAGMDD